MSKDQLESGIIVPFEKLSPEALDGLLEEFVLREGTDYGNKTYTIEEKKEQVYKQIKAKYVVVVYDQISEACTLLKKENTDLKNL